MQPLVRNRFQIASRSRCSARTSAIVCYIYQTGLLLTRKDSDNNTVGSPNGMLSITLGPVLECKSGHEERRKQDAEGQTLQDQQLEQALSPRPTSTYPLPCRFYLLAVNTATHSFSSALKSLPDAWQLWMSLRSFVKSSTTWRIVTETGNDNVNRAYLFPTPRDGYPHRTPVVSPASVQYRSRQTLRTCVSSIDRATLTCVRQVN